MEKDGNYLGNFHGIDYNSLDVHNHHHQEVAVNQEIGDHNSSQILDCMLPNQHQPPLLSSDFCSSNSFDKLSFADVMQFADFGPKLGLNHHITDDDEEMENKGDNEAGVEKNTSVQLGFLGEKSPQAEGKSKRKRPRTVKTVEEVESQRMTHIAVERNRRKQMNEHLRVLRSLMPSSYVQRGDQASIIGGVIEFVRELEELLQCLESQKRRRLYGDPSMAVQQFPANDQGLKAVDYEEETAESKSCLADVEVKVLGFDGLIKILSRRRHGQLIKTIAALEDLQLTVVHTNITTIEQTVLYSFNVKIRGETRLAAEDLANSVQQIFSFIQPNSCI